MLKKDGPMGRLFFSDSIDRAFELHHKRINDKDTLQQQFVYSNKEINSRKICSLRSYIKFHSRFVKHSQNFIHLRFLVV